MKFLGITIDNQLKFQEHYQNVVKKLRTGLNGLILSKNILDYKAKLIVYHSLIHSHINYCPLVWLPNITSKEKKILINIQKKAVRIIFKAKYNEHTSKLFNKSNITKVENIVKKESIIITYKFLKNETPMAINDLYTKNIETNLRETRGSENNFLKMKKGLKKGEVMFEILNNWNTTKKDIRFQQNIKCLKKALSKEMNKVVPCKTKNCYSCKRS